jgi:hypothetical protein
VLSGGPFVSSLLQNAFRSPALIRFVKAEDALISATRGGARLFINMDNYHAYKQGERLSAVHVRLAIPDAHLLYSNPARRRVAVVRARQGPYAVQHLRCSRALRQGLRPLRSVAQPHSPPHSVCVRGMMEASVPSFRAWGRLDGGGCGLHTLDLSPRGSRWCLALRPLPRYCQVSIMTQRVSVVKTLSHGSGLMTCMFAWFVRSLDPTGKFADIDHLLRA